MEPISITATIAAKAAKEASVDVTAEAVREASREFIEVTTKELSQLEEITRSQEFAENFQSALWRDTYFQSNIPREPGDYTGFLRKLEADGMAKGKLGEMIVEAQSRTVGEVQTQVTIGDNRIDLRLEPNRNVKFTEITVRDGIMELQDMYVKSGSPVSMEIKNGSLPYLQNELRGHLQEQIKAGLTISDQSLVVINGDALLEMAARPEHAATLIQQVQDAGGRVVVGLPDYLHQKEILLAHI